MKEIPSTVTSKRQVTIPVEVRKHLGLGTGDKVSFVIDDAGAVELRAAKYPSVASLAGTAGSLPHPLDMDDTLEIAREEQLADEYRS